MLPRKDKHVVTIKTKGVCGIQKMLKQWNITGIRDHKLTEFFLANQNKSFCAKLPTFLHNL